MAQKKNMKIKAWLIHNEKDLANVRNLYKNETSLQEFLPWGGSDIQDVIENVLPDRNGPWVNDLLYIHTVHNTKLGRNNLSRMASEYLHSVRDQMGGESEMDIISISSGLYNGRLTLHIIVRIYHEHPFNFAGFFDYIGEDIVEKEIGLQDDSRDGKLIIPQEILDARPTDEDKRKHRKIAAEEKKLLAESDNEHPFLNQLDNYVPIQLPDPVKEAELIYSLKDHERDIELVGSYESFDSVYHKMIDYCSGTEKFHYFSVISGDETKESFMDFLEVHAKKEYVEKGELYIEDLPKLMDKLYTALFRFYVIQDLLDDPRVTDVIITGPDEIRTRIYGKTYLSDLTFINQADYVRFVEGICRMNNVFQGIPLQVFADTSNELYSLRITISAGYINRPGYPYIIFRKTPTKKPLGDDLIKANMLTPVLRDYLLDCGKHSKGVVFCGPPGSGKSTCLNWFLEEAYEPSCSILCIQEDDALFSNRKGIMFQHVVHYPQHDYQIPVNLEQLGALALVASANVFIIGEVKGAEICSAITLSNSGCRTAITIHADSSTEALDKMADLAMRGYAKNITEAKRMLKSFQTIVYLQDFKIQEISEVVGFDETKKDLVYRPIYRMDKDVERLKKIKEDERKAFKKISEVDGNR